MFPQKPQTLIIYFTEQYHQSLSLKKLPNKEIIDLFMHESLWSKQFVYFLRCISGVEVCVKSGVPRADVELPVGKSQS